MAIVMAAGGSRRFGRGDKLLARIDGKALLAHVLDHALAAPVGRVIVALPSRGGRSGRLVSRHRSIRVHMLTARNHRRGLGSSLSDALAAVRPIEREAVIFLGDMPDARWPRGLRLRAGQDAARPVRRGVPAHPVLVRTAVARAAVSPDDRGLLGRLDPARIASMRAGRANVVDIDTVAALGTARRQMRTRA